MMTIILGENNNEVDSELGHLLYNFISSKEKNSVTAAQFFSTFLQSLTKENHLYTSIEMFRLF